MFGFQRLAGAPNHLHPHDKRIGLGHQRTDGIAPRAGFFGKAAMAQAIFVSRLAAAFSFGFNHSNLKVLEGVG